MPQPVFFWSQRVSPSLMAYQGETTHDAGPTRTSRHSDVSRYGSLPARATDEIKLQRLGHASVFARGYGSQAANAAYDCAYALYNAQRDPAVRMPLFNGAWSQHHARAELPRSLQVGQEFLAAAHEGDADRSLRLTAHFALGATYLPLGNHAGSLVQLARKHQLPQYLALAHGVQAWTALHEARPQEDTAGFEQALASLAATGLRLWSSYFATGLAVSLAACDRCDEARFMIQQAIVDSDQTSQRWCLAEQWRVRGELFLRGSSPDPAEAVRSFERAIAIARLQQAALWELWAAISLARWQCDEGRRDEARAVLLPVYGWLAKEADGADVVEAAALLHRTGQAA